jgi:hypothetical protein
MLQILALGTQYIQVPISNTESINPTGDVVTFCFLGPYSTVQQAADIPLTSGATWYTGSWSVGTPYVARCLVGPNGGITTLAVGAYQVYVTIHDSPEIPILWSGPMVVS